ncbi:6-phosphogluconolactonase [Klebsiella michiganensis]|uniref:6-phosphogluconolactonase n=1 Tax=Klebsiella michiganensis TaxID=1134687 RepID=A0A7H4N3K7_9ENTR|nr:6-phosphogluconolactonase [Klebsiella michiganensis]
MTTVEGAGPRHMVFHPNQQYGYCVNELNSSVDVWELKDPYGKNRMRADAGHDAA